jgi:ketosteroid isomerase-like protein
MPHETPQDAEDAFYDALESGDALAMARVWEDSPEVACLLPLSPLLQGPEVMEMWNALFGQGLAFDIEVRHLAWLLGADTALHLVEERMGAPDPEAGPAAVLYASNLFRRGPDGWRLVLHQNSPTPPPPGAFDEGPQRL